MTWDLTTAVPQWAALLFPKLNDRAIQAIDYDHVEGSWRVSQAVSGDDGDTVISRLNPDGSLRSAMTLTDGGHGLGLNVTRPPGAPAEIWTAWNGGSSSSTHTPAKFAWSPGTLTLNDPSVTQLPRMGPGVITPYLNFDPDPAHEYNYVCIRSSEPNQTHYSYTRRLIDEWENGYDNPLGVVTVPKPPQDEKSYLQGVATYGDMLFILHGSADGVTRPWEISQYQWPTNPNGVTSTPMATRSVADLGEKNSNSVWGGRREPEGLRAFFDPYGKFHLTMGVSLGPQHGPHQQLLYDLPEQGALPLNLPFLEALGSLGEDWHYVGESGEPAFQNNWDNAGSGQPMRFRLDTTGNLHLQGTVEGGNSHTALFQLPASHRPRSQTANLTFRVDPGNLTDVARLSIQADGTVLLYHAGSPAHIYANCTLSLV